MSLFPGFEIFIFLMGVCVGSFLNVCIHRFPREESVSKGRSKCTQCGTQINWYDNIPLFSYLILRGKCRSCGKGFSFRYFLVELLTGSTWFFLWKFYGEESPFFWVGIVLFSILIGVTFTDLETGYIPDKFTFPGMGVGVVLSALFPMIHGETVWYHGLKSSAIGLLAGGGVILVMGLIGNVIFKKDTMGGGDIKLMAVLGAFLGMNKAVMVFFISPTIALPFALFTRLVKKEETIPYGPFIALAGAWAFLYGDKFLREYFYWY